MHPKKIDNFRKANASREFPAFKTLSDAEADHLRNRLAVQLDAEGTDPLSLLLELYSRLSRLSSANALDDSFDLGHLLNRLGIVEVANEDDVSLLVNWGRFDEIDEMRVRDFAEFFWDLWYPGADDIELFDHSLRWLVAIDHEGTVGVWRAPNLDS